MRRSIRISLASAAMTLAAAAPLSAQDSPAPRPRRAPIENPRGFAGAALLVAAPQGEFKNTTDN
ncbi:MAG: hypothetical protein MUF00_14960, partial [Gemmatimonadaceae bacterium]|nr:hypothetical protein [Gemmatimonadaceae bacterium]